MFRGLQQKWQVGGWRLLLIITTFAVGGSLTGYVGRKLMSFLGIDEPVLWVIVYVLLITLLWPLSVLLVSIPLGQFRFFTKYLSRMGSRITGKTNKNAAGQEKQQALRIAIFASGTGTNAQKIIEHVHNANTDPVIHAGLVVCNKPGAGVLQVASQAGVPLLLIERERFFRGDGYVAELEAAGIDFIVLAGFLWKVPASLTNAFKDRIINIHPALLPKYGGKGMYGHFVHEAVIANRETESGITIHKVDEIYDHGSIVFQATCRVLPGDDPQTLAARIHELEHRHFPVIVEREVLLAGKR